MLFEIQLSESNKRSSHRNIIPPYIKYISRFEFIVCPHDACDIFIQFPKQYVTSWQNIYAQHVHSHFMAIDKCRHTFRHQKASYTNTRPWDLGESMFSEIKPYGWLPNVNKMGLLIWCHLYAQMNFTLNATKMRTLQTVSAALNPFKIFKL